MKRKIILGLGAAGTALAMLPLFAAFEAHVINVTAKIENALSVTTSAIDFGTVFPQEHLEKPLLVALSESFNREDRVDDVEYFIRQKPKCGVTRDEGQTLVGQTWTGHVLVATSTGEVTIDCEQDRPDGVDQSPQGDLDFYLLPSLCEYLSKEEDLSPDNDETTFSFHKPWEVVLDNNGTPDNSSDDFYRLVWNDTDGRLSKAIDDFADNWLIDLSVPCFDGNHCAQDWADFVDEHDGETNADPDDYVQPIENEHKIFGCNLWVEVNEVSLNPNQCTDGEDNDGDGAIDTADPDCQDDTPTTEQGDESPDT
ncbi:MAG: hypothetical protein A3B37_00160 [Candidatus Sungbacteria bacterium RIFCSPLOWO2_01_FULL_59_16]|uniref:Uncharacterized protein n=1 Tax=Candidatus Sungbacteria bacterium RIFCSPLOWO2_01_FULL_59_16 TaxID=1802280 RepID=A0A1G2LCJ0_9BACT|nr:MAG: hypothetical protein A3B37_00160 [Candidatus Sungbacteria bacterium RIFCSPLOWO2_01_FULL_59_16]